MNNYSSVRHLSQRASGETGTLLGVFFICAILSIVLIVLSWVKSVKDERVTGRYYQNQPATDVERGPGGYQVVY